MFTQRIQRNVSRYKSIIRNLLVKRLLLILALNLSTILMSSEGTLDSTFGTGGSLSLATQVGSSSNNQSRAIQILSDGSIIAAISGSSNSYVIKYTSTGAVDATFGVAGICTLTGFTALQNSILIDTDNRIIICGLTTVSSSIPWIIRITANGIVDSSFNYTSPSSLAWAFVLYVAATQSSGKIIANGFAGSAQIVRYNVDGSLDTTFGSSGYVIFNGSNGYPNSVNAPTTVVIDANDNLYIIYVDTTNNINVIKLTIDGAIDTNWGINGIANLSYLNGYSNPNLSMALNTDNVLVVAEGTGSIIQLAGINMSDGSASSTFANLTISQTSNSLLLANLQASTDGNVICVSYNNSNSTKYIRVDSITSAGILDESFNNSVTPGTNQFALPGSSTSSFATMGSLNTNEQLYVISYGTFSGIQIPYISRLINKTFIGPVSQFPNDQVGQLNENSLSTSVANQTAMYGQNSNLFTEYLYINAFATIITDTTAQTATINAINATLDTYISAYSDQSNINFFTYLYLAKNPLLSIQSTLLSTYPGSFTEINQCFQYLYDRIAQFTT